MQSVFALDTAGPAARASATKFESRRTMHPQVRTVMDLGEVEQFEGELDQPDDVGTVVKTEEESEEEVMAEICGPRKRKRGRATTTTTRVSE